MSNLLSAKGVLMISGSLIILMIFLTLYWTIAELKKTKASRFKKEILHSRGLGRWIFAAAIAFGVIFCLAFHMASRLDSSAILTFDYTEASLGQNPDGTRFNSSDMISDEVIKRAIEIGGLQGKLTVSDIKPYLEVMPIVDGNSWNEDSYHVATSFKVSFKVRKRAIGKVDSAAMLTLITQAYKELFIKNYSDKYFVLEMEDALAESNDQVEYRDIQSYLTMLTERIQDYMTALGYRNNAFVASNGDTFGALESECAQLKNVLINGDLDSYLLHNGIAKNSDRYIARLNYADKEAEYEKERSEAFYENRMNAIELYAEEMTRVVLVPTWDTSGEYYMGRTKVGIDQLSVEAQQYSTSDSDIGKYLKTQGEYKDAIQAHGAGSVDQQTERMIAEVKNTIQNLSSRAILIGKEYTKARMNKCVTITVGETSFKRTVKFGVIVTVVVILLWELLLRLWHIRKKENYIEMNKEAE